MRKKLQSKPLFIIFYTVLLDLVGFGILMPILPVLMADPTSPFYLLPPDVSLKSAYIILGILMAIFPICQFFTAPILGQLSDKFGRKKLLVLTLTGGFLSALLFALAVATKNLPLLFFSRIIQGLTGGNIAIALAAIADVTKPEERAKNFGLVGTAFGLGSVLGPVIGGKLSDPSLVSWFTTATPFWFTAFLSLLNLILLIFLFPETNKLRRINLRIYWNKAIHNILHVYGLKELRPALSSLFLFDTGFTFYATFLGVFLISRFGYNQGDIGDFFMYTGAWVIATQALIIGPMAKRFREDQVLRVTFFAMAAAVLAYSFTKDSWQLFLIAPFLTVATGLGRSFINSLISRSASAEVQGEVMGISSSVSFLGQAMPPIISGFIAAQVAAQAPLYVASAILLLAGFAFIFFYKKSKKLLVK
jgi:DHA1 family tetracycline resistance protein-like MFS transporter